MNCFIWNTGMTDLGFSEHPYTWSNCHYGAGLIQEQLDRGLANGEWRSLFPRASVSRIARVASDHAPIFLDTLGDQTTLARPFHFEAFGGSDFRSKSVIANAWGSARISLGSPSFNLCQRLKVTKQALRRWNKEVFGHIPSKIKQLQSGD